MIIKEIIDYFPYLTARSRVIKADKEGWMHIIFNKTIHKLNIETMIETGIPSDCNELTMNYEKAIASLEQHLRIYYSVGIDDVEITETKGYWRLKKPCDSSCHHPIHGCLGNEGRIRHTISFTPSRREKSKFVSPYEVWKTIKNHV